MTKEQAIEICKKIIQQNNEIVKQTRLNKDVNAMQLTANCDKESLAIETVLSMLKENSAEIEQKNTELTEKNAKIKKKDKIIDLMTKAMDKIQDPQVCKYCDNNINLNHGYCVDAGKCKKGIKQYFERKSEE